MGYSLAEGMRVSDLTLSVIIHRDKRFTGIKISNCRPEPQAIALESHPRSPSCSDLHKPLNSDLNLK